MTVPKQLEQMQGLHGTDWYGAQRDFRLLLDELCPPKERVAIETTLHTFAGVVSDRWDELASQVALDYDGPRIESFDSFGNRCDTVWLPPPVRTLRQEVVEAGIFENRSQLEQFAKVYLLSHLGEVSVVCPLACTEGLIRVIRAVGSDFLKEVYLPKLLSTETPLAGAQFITEKDMGSDVGALVTEARADGHGTWRLYGEKWFCSAIDEYFLIAARPQGAPAGTDGVAIFLVPRIIDGRQNDLAIKRLKDKIGTRELPTAEIDLNGALGYNIGPIEKGFKFLMNYVINTSRLMNAASACGLMARAWLEAENYTRQRSAFGQKIDRYPLVQESLNKIRGTLAARRALFFRAIARIDAEPPSDLESNLSFGYRFLINLCKYRTAIGATHVAHEAILLLGGNGTIENFSILPRLYRDALVVETWEGSHNTLALQICRDGPRFPFREFLSEMVQADVATMHSGGATDVAQWVASEWESVAPSFGRLEDREWVGRNAIRLMNRLGGLLETAALGSLVVKQAPADLMQRALLEEYCSEARASVRPFYP